jgi:glycosyltransferase involved in cell wall biosynthesis
VSTFEGFGMPIVEANCVERVVLTSNISSMPEVAGNAACLVNPYAIEDIRAGFLKIIHDASYREQLIKNGRQNRQRFDESLIAASYYKLYQLITSQIHER